MRLSIIVPLHNDPNQAAECLGSLTTSTVPDCEIIAVDDGSTDDTPAVAAALGVRVLRLGRNSGPAVARNAGAACAAGDILVFVDQDVVAPPAVIERIARAFEERPELAAVFGSYDAAPRARGLVSQFRNLLHHYVHQCGDPDASTFWTGCGAVRREVFQELGGFRPETGVEDIDLGYRLRRLGHRILLDRELQVKHLKVWTLGSMIRTDVAKRALPWTRLIRATGVAPGALNLRPAQRWSVGLTALLPLLSVASPLEPILLIPAGAVVLAIVTLNAGFYRFLRTARGNWFALASVPLHLIYFGCCGLGAALAYAGIGRVPERTGA
jgi:cellulose synthase/poly-beta-1,6-N-acetylglucosamine synthase-like glycosyltransferase